MIIKEQGSSACALQCLRRWGCRSWDCLLVETSEGSRNLVKSQIVKNWWDTMNVRFHKPTNPEKNDTSTERPCLEHNNIILKWSSIICKPCKHKRCGPRSALADAFLWHCPFRTNKLSLEIKWIRRTWSLKSLHHFFQYVRQNKLVTSSSSSTCKYDKWQIPGLSWWIGWWGFRFSNRRPTPWLLNLNLTGSGKCLDHVGQSNPSPHLICVGPGWLTA